MVSDERILRHLDRIEMKLYECEDFRITKSCPNGHQGLNRSKVYGSYGSYGDNVRMWNLYSEIFNLVYRGSEEDGERRGYEKTELELKEGIKGHHKR